MDDLDLNQSPEVLRAWSLQWEAAEGWDSIETIERVYWTTGDKAVPPTDGGAYVCCWPDCYFARKDAVELWKHVHFSEKHRLPRHSGRRDG